MGHVVAVKLTEQTETEPEASIQLWDHYDQAGPGAEGLLDYAEPERLLHLLIQSLSSCLRNLIGLLPHHNSRQGDNIMLQFICSTQGQAYDIRKLTHQLE